MTSFRNSSKSNRDSFVSVLKRVIGDTLRGSSQSNRKSRIYKRKPGVEGLEDRRLLVIGAFDIPGPILAGEGFDGVARFNNATGALLSSARHLLTAAHTGLPGSADAAEFVVLGPNGAVNISTPGAGFIQHPNYQSPGADNFDIAVQPLAELAPLTAERWDVYSENDEMDNVGTLVGYGGTGTGTIGHSTDNSIDQYWSTSTGQKTNYEVHRFTFLGNPTGGFFSVQLGDDPAIQVPYDTDAATFANRLDLMMGFDPFLSEIFENATLVRLVGDIDFDGIVDNFGNPHAGSFEVLFRGTKTVNHEMPDEISVTNSLVGGDIVVEKLLDGGSPRIKTGGTNFVGDVSADGFRLYSDFDDGTAQADVLGDGLGQGANEAYGTWGDSGSPLFIDGKIAGVLEGLYNSTDEGVNARGFDGKGGSGDFGQYDSWARVSAHLDFINNILDDPFDLVLNMANQPWGNDQFDDTIAFSRVGNTLRIHIDGVLRYTEDIGLIQSVTFRGSDNNETITVGDLGSLPIFVYGNGGNDVLVGGPGDEVLDGGEGNDTIQGGSGNDTIYGQAGNDFIGGWLGDDLILGGRGDDIASGDQGDDIVVGEDGNDLLAGGDGNDTVTGGSGNDILVGGVFSAGATLFAETGDDTLDGGDDEDTLYGDSWAQGAPQNFGFLGGNDTIQGGLGNDTIYGQAGNDFIGGWLGDDLILCGFGNDIASGDGGNDIVAGEAGNDLVAGGDGNDTVTGGSGNDILVGGVFSRYIMVPETGDDTLDGGDDEDTLYGDSWAQNAPLNFGLLGGDDTIQGGLGNDTIYGQAGNDFIGGGLGDDLILCGIGNDIASGDGGNDIVVGEEGNDLVAGGDGNDTVTGSSGNDILVGGVFSAGATLFAETGDDSLDGGDGEDTLYGDSWAFGAPLNFGFLGGDDTIQGGPGNDTIYGQAGNDFIGGWLGNDLIFGGQGDDIASGDQGNDEAHGESGNDVVAGGDGNDTVTGGGGNDILVGGLFSAGASVVAETGADSLDGGSGADTLFGDSWALGAPLDFGVQGGSDTLRGGSGNDLVVGQAGDDSLDGGAGNDTLLGAAGNDLLRGGGDNDQLGGGAGNDLLLGENGDDALAGGDGRDVLIGGLGSDTLDGGTDDDILIAGTTAHDANDVALKQIMNEWTSARNYQTRVKNIKGTGNGPNFDNRLNGTVFLIRNNRNGNGNGPAATVFDDDDNDTLTGSTGDDWFLSDNLDDLMDRVGGETKN